MRLFATACALLAGEAIGFAAPELARFWPLAVALAAFVALVSYGWSLRIPPWAWTAAAGAVLAFRADAVRDATVDPPDGNPLRTLVLRVEEEGYSRTTKRGEYVTFASRIGPQKVNVTMPPGRIPKAGETWRCAGNLTRPCSDRNRWRARHFAVKSRDDAKLVAPADPLSPAARYAELSAALARRVSLGLGRFPELAGICRAVLLGRRGEISRERREKFVAAGTVHVFAISGLHVMLVAHVLVRALALLGVPLPKRGLVAVPLVAAYVVLTGARPSALRAAVMAAAWLLAPAFGRRADSLAAWSFAAIVCYGLSPQLCFDVGCTMSFAVMLAIVAWLRWVGRDENVLTGNERLDRTFGAFGVTFVAWAAGVPITAHTFMRFTLGGLIANVFVIRLAPFLVSFAALGALSADFPPFAIASNLIAAGAAWTMEAISKLVAAIPFASFEVTPWPIWACAAWYLAFFFAAFAFVRWKNRPRVL